MSDPRSEFALCYPPKQTAQGHIQRLVDGFRKAPTIINSKSLCGELTPKSGASDRNWNLDYDRQGLLTEEVLRRICPKCVEIYKTLVPERWL